MVNRIVFLGLIIAASSAPALAQQVDIESSSWFKRIISVIESNTSATESNTKALNDFMTKQGKRSAFIRPVNVGISCNLSGCSPSIETTIKSLCKEVGYDKAVVGDATSVQKPSPPREPNIGLPRTDTVIKSVICFD